MDPQIVGAVLAFAGLLLTQILLHQRWTRDQDDKRQEFATTQTDQRREEQREILDRMAAQSNAVVENAVRLAEVHQEDAEKARVLAIETARAHSECRQEVAVLAGQVTELRGRIVETERTAGNHQRVAEADRGVKHDALNALTISEGTMELVQVQVAECTCGAFKSINHLVTSFLPRAPALVEANRQIRGTTLATVSEGIGRIETAQAEVAADLAVAQAAVDGVATDLAQAHERADATVGPAGEAADAFTRGPGDER